MTFKLTLKIFLATISCFAISLALAVVGNVNSEKDYPNSLVNAYVKKGSNTQSVQIDRKIPAFDISEIVVEATKTEVIIAATDRDELSVQLAGNYSKKGPDADSILIAEKEGSRLVLKIDELESENDFIFQFGIEEKNRLLTVNLPKSIKNLTIKTVSGEVDISSVELDDLALKTISGDISLATVQIKNLIIKTVSGDVNLEGQLDQLSGQTISGDLNLNLTNIQPKMDINSTSGNVNLSFKSEPSLKVDFSTVSGTFNLAQTDKDYDHFEGNKLSTTIGGGLGTLSAKTISGDVNIESGQY